MTNSQELEKKYTSAAERFAKLYDVVDPHVIHIIRSVMYHRDMVLPGGGFVEAVASNNLTNAINRADAKCLANLKVIVAAKNNCYVEEYAN